MREEKCANHSGKINERRPEWSVHEALRPTEKKKTAKDQTVMDVSFFYRYKNQTWLVKLLEISHNFTCDVFLY